MLGYASGMAGFPLRLLARENYDKLLARLDPSQVALITGEEKLVPPNARYFCCTVEAMPLERDVDCVLVDEIQLCADRERGHIFTDRLLHARGRHETLFLGAHTMRPLLQTLLPGAEFISRDRFSRLSYAGQKKTTRLQRRAAIVAFSAAEVYRLAELLRRQRGGAAVVMGALSPRTRNAQVELYQNGDVDFLIATDAIGMGLNMDIGHVALADDAKFDGQSMRRLSPAELAQIAGRAGRHTTDGTFGVTEDCRPLEQEVIDAIETHYFPPIRQLYWRARKLNFNTLDGLLKSLEKAPPYTFLVRKGDGVDHLTLQALAERPDIRTLADSPGRLRILWDVAQIPDFRKTLTDSHVVMVARIFDNLTRHGQLDSRWVAAQLSHLDRLDGDIDTLMTRIAHIRTWTYITHKNGWTDTKQDWQEQAKSIEDRLSDELHNRLTQRFVDKRVAHLSRRLKESTILMASVRLDGTVLVEGEDVGRLDGFTFYPSLSETGGDADEKAMILAAARKGLPDEIERRVTALTISADPAFRLDEKGQIVWRDSPVGCLVRTDSLYAPRAEVGDSDLLSSDQKARIASRLSQFITDHVHIILGPLVALSKPDQLFPAEQSEAATKPAPEKSDPAAPYDQSAVEDKTPAQAPAQSQQLSGAAKGLVWQIYEGLGAVERRLLTAQLRETTETDKPLLAKAGIRVGTETVYLPDMLKPAQIALRVLLWSLHHQTFPSCGPPPEGRVSFPVPDGAKDVEVGFWMAAGYRRLGPRIMRVDMVERVAALVRAAARDGVFEISDAMLSLAGVGRGDMALMLGDLGCRQVGERPPEEPEKPAIAQFERLQKKRVQRPQKKQTAHNKEKHKDRTKSLSRNGHKQNRVLQRRGGKEPDPNSPFAILAALKK
jgi:ATP-dependent RNA helicase SUPV3L1/SUV3